MRAPARAELPGAVAGALDPASAATCLPDRVRGHVRNGCTVPCTRGWTRPAVAAAGNVDGNSWLTERQGTCSLEEGNQTHLGGEETWAVENGMEEGQGGCGEQVGLTSAAAAQPPFLEPAERGAPRPDTV